MSVMVFLKIFVVEKLHSLKKTFSCPISTIGKHQRNEGFREKYKTGVIKKRGDEAELGRLFCFSIYGKSDLLYGFNVIDFKATKTMSTGQRKPLTRDGL